MAELEALFTRYDQLVVFDTETTGLYPNRVKSLNFPQRCWSGKTAGQK